MEIHHLISQRFEDFIFKKVSAMVGKNTGLRSMNKVAHPRFFVAPPKDDAFEVGTQMERRFSASPRSSGF